MSNFSSSACILSLLILLRFSANVTIAFFVSSSISKLSAAANLTALNILSASSLNLSIGLPTHLIRPLSNSPTPSNSSTIP